MSGLQSIINQLWKLTEEKGKYAPLDELDNPIWNDEKVIDLTEDDEWHGTVCYGVEIDTNAHLAYEDGTVSFVLYVRPQDATEGPDYVMADEWCQMIIRVPLDLTLACAEPEHIIQAIQQRGN